MTSLVKQLDKLVSPANKRGGSHSFVTFLSDDPDEMETKVKKLQTDAKLKNTPLTLFDGEAGHPDYKIAKEAEVTVLMWDNLRVKKQLAFKKGELNEAAIKKIVEEAKKHVK